MAPLIHYVHTFFYHIPRALASLPIIWALIFWSTVGFAAEPLPAALPAADRLEQICGPEGKQIALVVGALGAGTPLFALPGEAITTGPAPEGCDPAQPMLLAAMATESWRERLPVVPGSAVQVLWRDGSRRPARVLGVVQQRSGLYLAATLDEPPQQAPPSAPSAPDGGTDAAATPAAGAPAAGAPAAGAPVTAPAVASPAAAPGPELGAVALLLSPTPAGPAPTIDPNTISGTLRRRVGRQSFAVPGRFIGEGGCLTAIFKRRAEGLQMAIFGDDGGLRLYQTVPWRKGPVLRLKPSGVFQVPDLSGTGRDGLLVAALADSGATSYLLVEFVGKTVRASFQETSH